jgi:branched-chain amino acid aminotransferase
MTYSTQFFISPVSLIGFEGKDMDISFKGSLPSGGYAGTIKGWLGDIMFGNEDHEWGVVVEKG